MIPWDDCKIAFGVTADVEDVWNIKPESLPSGWTLNETDSSGARLVAVFRVEGIPTAEDGTKVAAILASL